MLERNHQKLQKDFEKWLEVLLDQNSILSGLPVQQNTLKESQRSNLNTVNISGISSSSKSVLKNNGIYYNSNRNLQSLIQKLKRI